MVGGGSFHLKEIKNKKINRVQYKTSGNLSCKAILNKILTSSTREKRSNIVIFDVSNIVNCFNLYW